VAAGTISAGGLGRGIPAGGHFPLCRGYRGAHARSSPGPRITPATCGSYHRRATFAHVAPVGRTATNLATRGAQPKADSRGASRTASDMCGTIS